MRISDWSSDVCSSDLDRGLDGDLEEVAGDEVLEPLAHVAASRFGGGAVNDHREGVDRLAVDQDVHLDEIALAVPDLVIVEAGIAAADALQAIVEVEHDLVQRQLVGEMGAAGDAGPIILAAGAVQRGRGSGRE